MALRAPKPLTLPAISVIATLVAATPAAASAAGVLNYRFGPSAAPTTTQPPAATSAAAGRIYAGSTTHGVEPLVLEVRNRRLTRVVAEYGGPCFAYSNQSTGAQIRAAALNRRGRVSATIRTAVTEATNLYSNSASRGVSVVERVTATVGATTARGTLQATVTFADGTTCTSYAQRFTIYHRGGYVYGGVTSQEMPVVLELDDARSRVQHFHIGWVAECADGSFSVVPDYLVDFPITRGRWGDVFQQDYQGADLRWTLRYEVSGTLSTTRGTGRMSVDIAGTDATGAVTQGCNTRPLQFSVRP